MRVEEIKGKMDFYTDCLFQAGYNMGWNAVLCELDALSDAEWNQNNRVTAEVIRKVVKQIREEMDDADVA